MTTIEIRQTLEYHCLKGLDRVSVVRFRLRAPLEFNDLARLVRALSFLGDYDFTGQPNSKSGHNGFRTASINTRGIDIEQLDLAVIDDHRVALAAHAQSTLSQIELQAGGLLYNPE